MTNSTETDTRKRRRLILTVLVGLLLLLVVGLLVRPSGGTTSVKAETVNAEHRETAASTGPQEVTDLPVDAERGLMVDVSALTHIEGNDEGKVTVTVDNTDGPAGRVIGFATRRWFGMVSKHPVEREIVSLFHNPVLTVKDGSELYLVYVAGTKHGTEAVAYTVCPESDTDPARCVVHKVKVRTVAYRTGTTAHSASEVPVHALLPGTTADGTPVTITVDKPGKEHRFLGVMDPKDREQRLQSPESLTLANGDRVLLVFNSPVGWHRYSYTLCPADAVGGAGCVRRVVDTHPELLTAP